MKRFGAWAVTAALGLVAGNVGCYYDQWQNEAAAHRTTQEKLAEARDDLHNAELLNAQKDTKIAALTDQINTKDQSIASLQAENQSLREALAKAQAILEKQAGKGAGEVHILTTKLPPALHEALRRLADQFPDQVEYLPEKGAVRWKADLLFPLGSDELASAGEVMQALAKFAEIVSSQAAAGFDVIVVGHTCTTPIVRPETLARFKNNWYLSAARAIAVMQLLADQGVVMARMGIMGYGEYRPIADNSSADGKARNRRVEIYLVPREAVQSVGMGVYESPERGIAFLKAPGKDANSPAAMDAEKAGG